MTNSSPIAAKDLKVVITGGARGIGGATAAELAALGSKVFITDVLAAEGNALATKLGANVTYADLDVTDPSAWQKVLAQADTAIGGVNALFNNAGIVSWGNTTGTEPADFRKVIDVNLYGVFLGLHFTAPFIKKAGGGAIVNVSSTAGLQGYAGIAAYVASKWGVRGLTKAAALDLAPDNIRVMSLHPGPIHTPMTANVDESIAGTQPIARFGEPEEVARMVRFMLLEATYSTGSEFTIDGGAVTGQVVPLPES
jgi:3alpha(or 20beta)-hydroxysteroid dehydrogenase